MIFIVPRTDRIRMYYHLKQPQTYSHPPTFADQLVLCHIALIYRNSKRFKVKKIIN
jgi:hypothetical protein